MRSRFGCPPSRTEFFMLWTTRETGKRIVAGRSAACWAKFFVKYNSPWSHIKVQNSTFGANISCLALPAMFLPLSLSCTWFSCLWKLLCTSWWILCERDIYFLLLVKQPPTLCPKSTAGTSFFTFLVCISWYGKFSKLRALWYAHWSQTDIQRKLWEVMKIFVSGREG